MWRDSKQHGTGIGIIELRCKAQLTVSSDLFQAFVAEYNACHTNTKTPAKNELCAEQKITIATTSTAANKTIPMHRKISELRQVVIGV
jgi:hypothetical protein